MSAPNITFEILRQIAETASGLRNDPLYFIVSGDPATFTWQTDPPTPSEDVVIIPMNAVPDPAPRVKVATVGAEAGKTVDLMNIVVKPRPPYPGGTYAADAVFWSVSALEKFVVPYYASVYGDDGPEHARAVLDVLMRPSPGDTDGEPAFAVAHLPSSEYVPVEYGVSIVPNAVALTSRGGHIIHHRH